MNTQIKTDIPENRRKSLLELISKLSPEQLVKMAVIIAIVTTRTPKQVRHFEELVSQGVPVLDAAAQIGFTATPDALSGRWRA